MEVQVINPVGARVGDRVVIGFKTESLIRVSFLLYIFPIFSMILGAVIGHKLATIVSGNQSGFSAVFGFLFLFLAFVIVKFTGDKLTKKDKYQPKIIRILT
jgi:sigma-E factor negative regulatory protein RseC|tara:strand:+ start:14427 stop:14729 length:303 start_codon:yes stop_codon:yes gene_type:complete